MIRQRFDFWKERYRAIYSEMLMTDEKREDYEAKKSRSDFC